MQPVPDSNVEEPVIRQFTDTKKRTWTVHISVFTIEKLRTDVQVDLLEVLDPNSDLLERLASDPVLLVGLLYAVCEEQLEKQQISPEDFASGLGGMSLGAASQAFLEALADFFPPPKGPVLMEMATKIREGEQAAADVALERFRSLDLKTVAEEAANAGASSSKPPAPPAG